VLAEMKPRAPLVVRLSGTRASEGRALLEGKPLRSRATMDEAATEAVRLAGSPSSVPAT
jgi:succinyl-CoA synthetase beta subunit